MNNTRMSSSPLKLVLLLLVLLLSLLLLPPSLPYSLLPWPLSATPAPTFPPSRTRKDTILIVCLRTNGTCQKIGGYVVCFDFSLERCGGEAGHDLARGGEGGFLPCL